MIKRFFSLWPLLIFISLLAGAGFCMHKYVPQTNILVSTSFELLETVDDAQLPSLKINEEKIKILTTEAYELLKKQKFPTLPLLSYIEDHPVILDLYPSNIDIKISENNENLSLSVSFTPNFYHNDAFKNINDKNKLSLYDQ